MTGRRDVRAALHAALDEWLDAAENELRLELEHGQPAAVSRLGPPRARAPRPTELQAAQGRLLELIEDVIEGCSDAAARAFFAFFLDTAARHARRASSPDEAA